MALGELRQRARRRRQGAWASPGNQGRHCQAPKPCEGQHLPRSSHTPRRRRDKRQGWPPVSSEGLVDEAGLLQHRRVSRLKVGSLRSGRQHQELGDDAADPDSGIGVVASLAGSFRAGGPRSIRGGNPPGGIRGGRRAAEALVLLILRQREEALGRRDRGMSVNDRGLECPLLREEVILHGDEAVQLPAALLRRPLSPQEEGT